MSSRGLIAIAFVVVILGSAGCSSTSDSPSGSPSSGNKTTPAGQAALPQCPSAAEITSGLGIAYGEPIVGGKGKERSCVYAPTDGRSGIAMLHFETLKLASDFGAVKTGYGIGGRTTVDVSGLGDQAFSSVLSVGGVDTNTMAALKGTLHILVTSQAPLDQEKTFVAKLLG